MFFLFYDKSVDTLTSLHLKNTKKSSFHLLKDGRIYDSFTPQLRHLPFLAIDAARCQRELRKVKKLGSFFKLNPGVLCSRGTATPDTCHVSMRPFSSVDMHPSEQVLFPLCFV